MDSVPAYVKLLDLSVNPSDSNEVTAAKAVLHLWRAFEFGGVQPVLLRHYLSSGPAEAALEVLRARDLL